MGCAVPTGFGSATNVAQVQPGETVVIVGIGIGIGAMTDVDVKLNLFLFIMLQKTLKGNIFGGGSSHVETPKLAGLYRSGLRKIDEMITNTYSLDNINDGHQDMVDGKNIRGVIKFSESDW